MSLQVWLPLNGNINNQGISNVTVTNNGATVSDSGKIGKCYEFGSNKYMDGDFTMNYSEWTLVAWINGTGNGFNGQEFIISLNDNSTTDMYCALGVSRGSTSTRFIVRCYVGGVAYNFVYIDFNKWTHLTLTYSNGTAKLYVNGSLSMEKTGLSLIQTSSKLSLGKRYGSSSFNFDGKINDVRIYDHALSPKEVKEISQGLVLHYKLDYLPTSGDVVYDCSGYNNDGTISGSLSLDSNTPRYDYSTSKASSSYIQSESLTEEARSVSFWCKWKTSVPSPSVVFCDYKSKLAFGLGTNGIICSSQPLFTKEFQTPTLVADTWYHIVVVNTGDSSASTNRELYINGVKQTQLSSTNYWTFPNDVLDVGSRSNIASSGINGSISDFRMYTTALSDQDIIDLYNTSAYIDNGQNLHCYEFTEDDVTSPEIEKTGIVKTQEFNEFPDDVVLYDYIQSDGNQYINSQVIMKESIKVDCKFQSLSNALTFIYGTSNSNQELSSWSASTNANWRFGHVALNPMISYTPTDINRVIHDKTGITINNVQQGTYSGTFSFNNTTPINIFGNSVDAKSSIKLYYFKIYDNDVLVRDYLPCTKNGEVGLWDRVHNQFYSNSGTGTFTLGNPIQTVTSLYQDKINTKQMIEL